MILAALALRLALFITSFYQGNSGSPWDLGSLARPSAESARFAKRASRERLVMQIALIRSSDLRDHRCVRGKKKGRKKGGFRLIIAGWLRAQTCLEPYLPHE